MKSFVNILKSHNSKKYSKILVNKSYIKSRVVYFKKILSLKTKKIVPTDKYQHKKILITKDFLQKTLPRKKNLKNDKILISLYEKFNYSLKLKKKYNFKMKKLSNENVDFSAYIYLGNQLINFTKINELQKLNCILKINDISLINFKKKENLKLIHNIKKNIKYEIKLINKYAKKFIGYSS